MSGTSVIFGFPFRIYGERDLPLLDGRSAAGNRIRIHRPMRVRQHGMPLSPDVPNRLWPDFQWSLALPQSKRILPPSGLTLGPSYSAQHSFFDGLRIDSWGNGSEHAAHEFVPVFMRWLRMLSRQPWIGNFECQTDFSAKYEFAIDGNGYTSGSIFSRARVTTPLAQARPVTEGLYREAFKRALLDEPTQVYWEQWLDAGMFIGMDRARDAAMALALSLESGRDAIFPAFAPTKMRESIGEVLISPFDGTDMLRHLSDALEQELGRNLKREQPALFSNIQSLYAARHNIAHGKSDRQISAAIGGRIDGEKLKEWSDATFATLTWIEALTAK